jgi:hypothetical protein
MSEDFVQYIEIYLYLGMLGVETPPLYGLTEEEVKALSARGGGE